MIYIGQRICLCQRIKDLNSGNESNTTQPEYMRSFKLIAYICGFGGGRKQLRKHIEYKWKVRQNQLIINLINDLRRWSRYGQDIINQNTV